MSQHIHLLKQLTLLWPCYKANFKISGHWICKFFDIATVHQYSMCDMHLPWWVPVSEYVQYIALAIPPSYDSSSWNLDLTETQFSVNIVPSLCIGAYPVVLALCPISPRRGGLEYMPDVDGDAHPSGYNHGYDWGLGMQAWQWFPLLTSSTRELSTSSIPEMASRSADSSPVQSTDFSEFMQWMEEPKSQLKQHEDSLWVGWGSGSKIAIL